MAENHKHIEDFFKESLDDFQIPGGEDRFAQILSATNKNLFLKFTPTKFNVYYLATAVTATSVSVPVILNNINKLAETNEIQNIIITDTTNTILEETVNKKTIHYNDADSIISNNILEENQDIVDEITKPQTDKSKKQVDSLTIDLEIPKNPTASVSEEIVPEEVEKQTTPEVKNENAGVETKETSNKKASSKNTDPEVVDSVIVLDKEEVIIKETKVEHKTKRFKKKGR